MYTHTHYNTLTLLCLFLDAADDHETHAQVDTVTPPYNDSEQQQNNATAAAAATTTAATTTATTTASGNGLGMGMGMRVGMGVSREDENSAVFLRYNRQRTHSFPLCCIPWLSTLPAWLLCFEGFFLACILSSGLKCLHLFFSFSRSPSLCVYSSLIFVSLWTQFHTGSLYCYPASLLSFYRFAL